VTAQLKAESSIEVVRAGDADFKYLISNGARYPADIDRLDDEGVRDAIVPSSLFWNSAEARPSIQTPAAVDYAWSRRTPIEYQGGRATCVSFALVAAMELFAARRGRKWHLSEQYANWAFNASKPADQRAVDGVGLLKGLQVLTAQGTCPRGLCRYEETDPRVAPSLEARHAARYAVSDYLLIDRRPLKWASDFGCSDEPSLDGPYISNSAYLECIIANNHDVVVTMAPGAYSDSADEVFNVLYCKPESPTCAACSWSCVPAMPMASHAMVIVGYNRIAPTPYFVLRDSAQGGRERHVFYSYDYLRKYARYGAVILNVTDDAPVDACEN